MGSGLTHVRESGSFGRLRTVVGHSPATRVVQLSGLKPPASKRDSWNVVCAGRGISHIL